MVNPILIMVFNFITGALCLIYGVNSLSKGLENMNIKIIRRTITRFSDNVFKSFAAGTVVTALVQSSAVVTAITVGLVNSGLMQLPQAVGIIYGANIGTTVTAQLISFKLTDLAIPILIIGLIIRFIPGNKALKNLGMVISGLGFMFGGIKVLNSGVLYIKQSKFVYDLFKNYGNNPFLGLVIGTITTMMIQSSTATVGLTIVLFNSHMISLNGALGLILGDNIGTCITAQLASIGTGIKARRAAWAHTLYNIIGAFLAMSFLNPFSKLITFITGILGQDHTRLIANAHTVFNLLSALVFLPFTKYYVKFIEWIVPDRSTKRPKAFLKFQ
ncbi:MAG TPA: Na/Pi cotransporter family protein [Clostridiaceae bacterium]|nr:Na/Pi cotransporter family protein [Clostridiaceae bacterium]